MPGYVARAEPSPPNQYFFTEIKDVNFGPGHVASEVIRTGPDRAVVRVRATGFNYFIRIPTPAPDVRFADNYLDLRDRGLVRSPFEGLATTSATTSCGPCRV
jgi:hypothetical protein